VVLAGQFRSDRLLDAAQDHLLPSPSFDGGYTGERTANLTR